MSSGRLILNFKDGRSLALDEEKLRAGAVIEIDANFAQAGLQFEEADWTLVDQDELQGRTIVKLSGTDQPAANYKRRADAIELAEAGKKIKSMVSTVEGRLVSATPTESQEIRKATLTATQRRNKNRRIRKMLTRLTACNNEGAVPVVSPRKMKESVHEKPAKRRSTPPRTRERGETSRKAEERTALTQRIVSTVPRHSVPKATPEDVLMENIPEEVRRVGLRDGVEPYIPQYITRPGQIQMIPEHELERIQKMEKQTFRCFERIQGREINILEGLELHTDVFSEYEQRLIVECVNSLQKEGQAGRLRRDTYSAPRKWMKGKGRVTIQCGCCYNFAEDRKGNPPGILPYGDVDPLPGFIKFMIKRMVNWRVLPADCIPNSCIINIYEEGDCIPPHKDHNDFVRPFSTVSLINECDILFGSDLRIVGPGKFKGPARIPLPVGSVLILQGNGADIAKHSIPGVPCKRISVTLRRMDVSKIPVHFQPDPEMENLQPYKL